MSIYSVEELPYPADMASKPASRPIAHAIPDRSGKYFLAQFALPGLVPDLVRGFDDQPVRYNSDAEARTGALNALFNLLSSRTVDRTSAGGYFRMTGAELATALNDAELTPTEFAEIYGVPQARVMGWLDGAQDIPHSAHVLVRLLAYEENYKEARSMTDRAQGLRQGLNHERNPKE